MTLYFKDEGIVLGTQELLEGRRRVTIFAKQHGKLSLFAYGTQKITSRRISHLDSANYIRFSLYQKGDRYFLKETELMYGYSMMRKHQERVSCVFTCLFVLYYMLAENQPEESIFDLTHIFLTKLNSRKNIRESEYLDRYLKEFLLKSGFIDITTLKTPSFSPLDFIEQLLGRTIKIVV